MLLIVRQRQPLLQHVDVGQIGLVDKQAASKSHKRAPAVFRDNHLYHSLQFRQSKRYHHLHSADIDDTRVISARLYVCHLVKVEHKQFVARIDTQFQHNPSF